MSLDTPLQRTTISFLLFLFSSSYSQFNVIICRIKKRCLSRIPVKDVPYYALLSLDDETYLWLDDTVFRTYTEMHIAEGHIFIFRGDVFHAGSACRSSRIFFSLNAACPEYSSEQCDAVYLDYCISTCGTKMDYSRMPALYEQARRAFAAATAAMNE